MEFVGKGLCNNKPKNSDENLILRIQTFSKKGEIMTDNLNFIVDKSKCINCGKCINDCSCKVLEFDINRNPKVVQDGEAKCIKCQHCLAVCPTGAISIFGKNPEDSVKIIENHNPENIINLIQTRRSIRQFKSENIDKKTLKNLREMLSWVPTGCNDHRLLFTFIDDRDAMNRYKKIAYTKLREMLSKNPVPKEAVKLLRVKNAINSGEDPIFRNAPHMIAVSSPKDAPCANIDPIIALSYFDLYAQSMGIGTLWCGLAYNCLNVSEDLTKELKIPNDYKLQYCMLFGYPSVKYKRGTQPDAYKIMTYGKVIAKVEAIIKRLKDKFTDLIK